MTGISDSGMKAAQSLGLDGAKAASEIMTKSMSPVELSSTLEKRGYVLAGMTPKDFNDLHSAYDTDITGLQKDFKEICEDYGDVLDWDRPSRAVEFCSKIIFEVGPESRQIKKSDGDRVWKFKFLYKSATNEPLVKVAFVSTFKATQPVKQTTEVNKMILTIKQAGLLAMDTFNKLACLILVPNGIYLLTPLAGAIFSRKDIAELATELKKGPEEALTIVNSSCQSGGHMLHDSRAHCAAVEAIVATRNLKDEKLQKSIVVKVVRHYINASKNLDHSKFAIYARYAHGGLPKGMDFSSLEAEFEKAQTFKLTAKKIATARTKTAMPSTVLAPQFPQSP